MSATAPVSTVASATIGQLLAAADAHLARAGGYRATAHCTAARVELIYRHPSGHEDIVSDAPMTPGRAPEDIAHELLVAEVREAKADRYFVTTFKD